MQIVPQRLWQHATEWLPPMGILSTAKQLAMPLNHCPPVPLFTRSLSPALEASGGITGAGQLQWYEGKLEICRLLKTVCYRLE